MFGTARVLRFAVSLTIAMSTLSVAAQDTPVDTGSKAPGTTAQPAATDTAALAKATQNPVASLISVPLQNNSNFGIGPYNRTGDIFNIQPVIPMKLSEKVMLITRIIQPLVWQPYPSQPTGGQAGIGDMNRRSFSPRRMLGSSSTGRDRHLFCRLPRAHRQVRESSALGLRWLRWCSRDIGPWVS
jgi:hypothetical protein